MSVTPMSSTVEMIPFTPALAAEDVNWARVEEGFYVGNHAGVFIGYIEKQSGVTHFAAHDGEANLLGRFATLIEAMTALTTSASLRHGSGAA